MAGGSRHAPGVVLVALVALVISTAYLSQAWREERLAKDQAVEILRLAHQTVDRFRQDARLYPLPPAGRSAPFGQALPPPKDHEK